MIPISSKITNFSLYLFVYFFENIIILAAYFAYSYTALQERMADARLKD